MKIIMSLLSVFLLTPGPAVGPGKEITDKNYILYNSKSEKTTNLDSIVNEMQHYDIILFGEEHNDSVAHHLQLSLLKKMHEKFGSSVVLSMEMFDRDVQTVLDEYLAGNIKESHFKKDARVWSNYRDYKPMVEFSKENKLQVVAANAPMRYVSLCNRKGIKGLELLSPDAKRWMAPLPFDTATGKYYEKLREIMGYNAANNKHEEKGSAMAAMMPSSLSGHSLWDATMAYSISTVFEKSPNAKVLHLNGRFHSDDYFGIYQQLQKYAKGKRVLVISAFSDDDFPKVNYKTHNAIADFIFISDPKVPKTFEN